MHDYQILITSCVHFFIYTEKGYRLISTDKTYLIKCLYKGVLYEGDSIDYEASLRPRTYDSESDSDSDTETAFTSARIAILELAATVLSVAVLSGSGSSVGIVQEHSNTVVLYYRDDEIEWSKIMKSYPPIRSRSLAQIITCTAATLRWKYHTEPTYSIRSSGFSIKGLIEMHFNQLANLVKHYKSKEKEDTPR